MELALPPPTPFELPPPLRDRPAILVAAHPGHELRLHGWLELARPEVWVLTDGAGRGQQGRLDSTARVLERAGATAGAVFGAFSDRQGYAMLLAGDVRPAAVVAERLASRLAQQPNAYVVADALEGFNPVHDLCRVLVEVASAAASGGGAGAIDVFDYPLEAAPDTAGARGAPDLRLVLDHAALERKLRAAREYPEMAVEVERAVAAHGEAAFAVERLRPAGDAGPLATRLPQPPLYERYGEERVAAGHYPVVLRLRQHFLPFAAAVAREVGAVSSCASS